MIRYHYHDDDITLSVLLSRSQSVSGFYLIELISAEHAANQRKALHTAKQLTIIHLQFTNN